MSDTVAEDILDGTCCQLCGCYFENPDGDSNSILYSHEYPVTCWECWEELSKEDKKEHQRATTKTI